ncbi:MAG: PH domain-containing protein [Clostridia bacterium]|nr:PH domain-containing protein [Clostridia bacterium]
MNYAEKNLNRNEQIVFQAKKSFLAVVPSLIWCIVLLAGVIVGTVYLGKIDGDSAKQAVSIVTIVLWVIWALCGVLPVIFKIINLACSCLCITNKRVIGKIGVLRIHTLDYPIDKVDNVSLKAGALGNLFHYHTVSVLGGGGGDAEIKFIGISNATQFKNSITEAVERHADEARKAQAEEIARAMSGSK